MSGRVLWLADVLRFAGLTVVEYEGWRTRGKATMNPGGVVCHHTGGVRANDRAYADFLVAGRSDLPGPLSQLFLAQDGRYWVLASGKANHAGRGGWLGLSGNSSVIGIEAESTGRDPWPDVQYEAYTTGVAAIMRRMGRTADFVCGHKEWATPAGRKWDPGGIDMDTFRKQVAVKMIPEKPDPNLTPEEVKFIRSMIAGLGRLDPPSGPGFAPAAAKHIRSSR